MPEDFGYLHAAWSQTATKKDEPVVINRIHGGPGHWVGTAVSMLRKKGENDNFTYLEGDESIYVDGEESPSWHGTGTEDYFNGGWYFGSSSFSRSLYGAPIMKKPQSRLSVYRFHLTDAVPFVRSR